MWGGQFCPQPAFSRLWPPKKGGCGQDWPPHKSNCPITRKSNVFWDRPELHRLLDQLRQSDVLVVRKLDRLSRSLRDVLTIMERLGESGA